MSRVSQHKASLTRTNFDHPHHMSTNSDQIQAGITPYDSNKGI